MHQMTSVWFLAIISIYIFHIKLSVPCWIFLTLCCAAAFSFKGRTEIYEPAIQPVYVQAGQDFELKCKQLDCMSFRWMKGTVELNIIAKSGFVTTSWEENRGPSCIRYGILSKTKATMADSGGYSCEPRLDANKNYITTVKVFESESRTSRSLLQRPLLTFRLGVAVVF